MKKTLCVLLSILLLSLPVSAHSGRTDSAGGHRDNKNASGLGPYHYHHGYPAHLHPNGVCPYESAPAAPAEASAPAAAPAAVTGKTDAEKALFLDTYIALIQGEGATVYHRLDCADFDEAAGFVAYNTASAEAMGYTACTKCH
ncbi:YHYH domain-containing protein [uncultured Anaerotruncus sp.]|uniref:YHYH domain-containing protein n=1 Tax=uncultured Anaerotruncus sp. TaxID=905011 RepID=UPI0035A5F9A0